MFLEITSVSGIKQSINVDHIARLAKHEKQDIAIIYFTNGNTIVTEETYGEVRNALRTIGAKVYEVRRPPAFNN